jgi:hypothetical protein
MVPMKSINHTINGLASSLLFNAGLTTIAQKLDPVSQKDSFTLLPNNGGASWSAPSNFTPKKVR